MGDDDLDAESAREEIDRQRKSEPPPALSHEEFLAWRSPRTVQESATRLDNPLWHWLVRTRWDAYHANKMLNGPSPFDAGPMWCFDRFGMSETPLPDGRVLCIGGEHEDSYDPDFHIYNDVTVVGPGDAIAIHGYPPSTFPPTDFHTATPVGNTVIVIGCLGYPEQRVLGSTPVFRLAMDSMQIERMDTSGDAPGWIHEHSAHLSDDGRTIVVRGGEVWLGEDKTPQQNIDTWALDTMTGQWARLTALDWQRWTMRRSDRKPNRLWDVRQALWHRDHAWPGLTSYWRFDDAPDFDALAALYRLDEAAPLPEEGPEYNMFHVAIDGVTVRFTEDRFSVQAIVEGRLSDDRLAALQRQTLAMLERLDASAWEIESP